MTSNNAVLKFPKRSRRRWSSPAHLAPETRRWFARVVRDWELEEHHVRLLAAAGEAWDRMQQARAIIAKDGMTYLDRFKQPRARPEIAIERDSRIAFSRVLRDLALDVNAPDDSRPPGIGAGRRRA